MKRRAGFTFMELMLTLSIMVVLAMIALPKMRGMMGRSELDAAVRDLTATLRYARHFAVLRGDGCQMVIDPEAKTYVLTLAEIDRDGYPLEEDASSRNREDSGPRMSGDFAARKVLPRNLFFTLVHSSAPLNDRDGNPRIVFYPDGSATSAILGVQDDRGKAFRINVYRTTGLAIVERGQPIVPRDVQPFHEMPDYVLYRTVP